MKVSPSLLSADFACLRPDIDMINNSEADYLHLDVMDGVFVPNISFGFPVMQAVARQCSKPLDVHLMIVNPDKWINQVRDLGTEIMNVHQEACPQLHSVVQRIHAAGMKAGVTINPATPVNTLVDTTCSGKGATAAQSHRLNRLKSSDRGGWWRQFVYRRRTRKGRCRHIGGRKLCLWSGRSRCHHKEA